MFGKEPTVIIGALAEIARAIVPLLIIFGYINWTDNQVAQMMLMIGVVVGVGEKLFTRSQVTPTVVADRQMEIAKASNVDRPTSRIVKEANESL